MCLLYSGFGSFLFHQTQPTNIMKTDFDYFSYQEGEKYGRRLGLLAGVLIGVTLMLITMLLIF